MYVCGYVQSTRNVQPIKKEDCRKIDLNPQNNYRLGKEISIYGWEWLTLRVQTRDHQWFQQFSENRIFERSKSDFKLYLTRYIYHVKLYFHYLAFYNFDLSTTMHCELIIAVISFQISNALSLYTVQVPKCFVLVQIFWASPKIRLHLVPLQKRLCQHKKQSYWTQTSICQCQSINFVSRWDTLYILPKNSPLSALKVS